MRRSSWLALLAVATCGAIAACASSGGGPASASDDMVDATHNAMGLQLLYDDPTGRVHATVKSKLQPGEKLVLRVRRGRLSTESQSALDCSELPEAPPLRQAPQTTQATRAGYDAPKVIYEGPQVDRSLLASVYSDKWIQANIAPPTLAQLSRDGADTIVEACIVNGLNGENVRASLQTSIQYVWDASDPNVAPRAPVQGQQ